MKVRFLYDVKHDLRSQKGLTLVEVMISLLLISFMSLSMLSAQTGSRHSIHMSRVHYEALETLKSVLENFKFQDYDDIDDQDLLGVTISDAGTLNVADDVLGDVNIAVTDNGDNTKTVSATVTWNYKMRSQDAVFSKTLTTMVADF
jgi:prepilin-type N-terminal cleavage/methylation domain-containing protein